MRIGVRDLRGEPRADAREPRGGPIAERQQRVGLLGEVGAVRVDAAAEHRDGPLEACGLGVHRACGHAEALCLGAARAHRELEDDPDQGGRHAQAGDEAGKRRGRQRGQARPRQGEHAADPADRRSGAEQCGPRKRTAPGFVFDRVFDHVINYVGQLDRFLIGTCQGFGRSDAVARFGRERGAVWPQVDDPRTPVHPRRLPRLCRAQSE